MFVAVSTAKMNMRNDTTRNDTTTEVFILYNARTLKIQQSGYEYVRGMRN